MKFSEVRTWDWSKKIVELEKKDLIKKNFPYGQDVTEVNVKPKCDSEEAVKSTELLIKIYERCNVTSLIQPATFEEMQIHIDG